MSPVESGCSLDCFGGCWANLFPLLVIVETHRRRLIVRVGLSMTMSANNVDGPPDESEARRAPEEERGRDALAAWGKLASRMSSSLSLEV